MLAMAAGFLAQIACFVDCKSPDLVGAALTNGLLAAAAGGAAAALLARWRYAVFDFHFALAGFLSGLISSAAGAATMPGFGAVLIGAVGGFLSAEAITWIDLRRKIDDPGAGFAIHAVSGAWGLLAAGLLATGSMTRQLLIQLGGIASIALLALIGSAAVFKILKATIGLTFGEADELDGSDLVEHELNAYPDFQQTMIKSYHLRET
jgi:Amt family ammonium transporter